MASKPLPAEALSGVWTTESWAMDFLDFLPEPGVLARDPSSPEPKEKPGVEIAGELGDAALLLPFFDWGVWIEAREVPTVSASKKASGSSRPSAPRVVSRTAIPVRLGRGRGEERATGGGMMGLEMSWRQIRAGILSQFWGQVETEAS